MIQRENFDDFLAAILRGEEVVWPETVPGWSGIDAAMARIRFHGLALALYEKVELLKGWPEELLESIRAEAHHQTFWEESHRRTMVELFGQLRMDGVEALLMKGSALAYSVYANPAMRRRGDSDVLVREAQLPKTRSVLRKGGFALASAPHGLFFQETWHFDTGFGFVHVLDLHWQPTDSPLLQQVLRLEDYFANPIALPRLDPEIHAAPQVQTLLQCMLNQAWHARHGYFVEGERVHGGERLVGALDVHLIVQSFAPGQWDELVRISLERQMAPIVREALGFAQRVLNTPIDDVVMQKLAAAADTNEVTRYLDTPEHAGRLIIDLRALKGAGARMRYLAGNAFPSREHLHGKYPGLENWPLPVLYVRRLLGNLVKLGKRPGDR